MFKLVRTLTTGQFVVHPSNRIKFTSTNGVSKLVGSYPEEEVLVVSSGKRTDMEALKRALDFSDTVCGKGNGIVAEKGGPAASKDSTGVSFVGESQTQKPPNSLAPSESKIVSSRLLEGPSAAKYSNGAPLMEGSQTQKPPSSPAPFESETVSLCPDPDILAQEIRSVLLEDTNESDLNDDLLVEDVESLPEEVNQITQLEKDLDSTATNTNKPIKLDPKETFCLFCSCKVRRFQRHLEAQHKTEEKVAEILKMECRSKKRRDAIAKLRNEGSFLHNMNAKDKKEFIVARRNTKSALAVCPGCKGSFSKRTMYRHARNCCSDIPPRSVMAEGHNVVVGAKFSNSNIETVPSEGFKTVLKSMHKNEIYEAILSDPVLVNFGNRLWETHEHLEVRQKLVSKKVKVMSRLLIELRKEDKSIDSLTDLIMHPTKYDIFMNVVKKMCGYEAGHFITPSLANMIGFTLTACVQFLLGKALKCKLPELKTAATDFLTLHRIEFHKSIGNKAVKYLEKKKWEKPKLLPLTEDVKLVNEYLDRKINRYANYLKHSFDSSAFKELNKVVLCKLLLFNRKRVGEVEQLKITDFEKRHKVTEGDELYNTLGGVDKILARCFIRIVVRGKWSRPVPMLITKEQEEAICIILNHRQQANVGNRNPFVFGKGSCGHFSGNGLLQQYASSAGAVHCELFKSTPLRKHMATMTQTLSMKDTEMRFVEDFLGHDKNTESNFYRQPTTENVAIVSRLLLLMSKGTIHNYRQMKLKDINLQQELEEETDTEDNDGQATEWSESSTLVSPIVSTEGETSTDSVPLVTGVTMPLKDIPRPGPTALCEYPPSTVGNMKTKDDSIPATIPLVERKEATRRKLFPDTPHRARSPQRDTSWNDRRESSEDEPPAPSSPPVLKKKTTTTKKKICKKATKRSLMNDDDDSSHEKQSRTIKRFRWTKPEKKSILKHFGKHLKNLTLPTLPDCRKVIEMHRHLMHRTPEQMKAFINNQNRKRKKAESDGTQKKIKKTLLRSMADYL